MVSVEMFIKMKIEAQAMKHLAGIGLVAIVALASLVFISSPSINPMIAMEKVMAAFDPADYRTSPGCYIGLKQELSIVPGKRIRLWDTHAADSYDHWVTERDYELCGTLREDTPSHAHYFLCPPMSNCKVDPDGFICQVRTVTEVEYCD